MRLNYVNFSITKSERERKQCAYIIYAQLSIFLNVFPYFTHIDSVRCTCMQILLKETLPFCILIQC